MVTLSEELTKIARQVLAVTVVKSDWMSIPEFLHLAESGLVPKIPKGMVSKDSSPAYVKVQEDLFKEKLDKLRKLPKVKVKFAGFVNNPFKRVILHLTGLTRAQLLDHNIRYTLYARILPDGTRTYFDPDTKAIETLLSETPAESIVFEMLL